VITVAINADRGQTIAAHPIALLSSKRKAVGRSRKAIAEDVRHSRKAVMKASPSRKVSREAPSTPLGASAISAAADVRIGEDAGLVVAAEAPRVRPQWRR
jgi:hypothetical protein